MPARLLLRRGFEVTVRKVDGAWVQDCSLFNQMEAFKVGHMVRGSVGRSRLQDVASRLLIGWGEAGGGSACEGERLL